MRTNDSTTYCIPARFYECLFRAPLAGICLSGAFPTFFKCLQNRQIERISLYRVQARHIIIYIDLYILITSNNFFLLAWLPKTTSSHSAVRLFSLTDGASESFLFLFACSFFTFQSIPSVQGDTQKRCGFSIVNITSSF
jgi:hypothetical protein